MTSPILVTACAALMVCVGLPRHTAGFVRNANSNFEAAGAQTTGLNGGAGDYRAVGGNNNFGALPSAQQDVTYSTGTGGQFNSVKIKPSAFDNKPFSSSNNNNNLLPQPSFPASGTGSGTETSFPAYNQNVPSGSSSIASGNSLPSSLDTGYQGVAGGLGDASALPNSNTFSNKGFSDPFPSTLNNLGTQNNAVDFKDDQAFLGGPSNGLLGTDPLSSGSIKQGSALSNSAKTGPIYQSTDAFAHSGNSLNVQSDGLYQGSNANSFPVPLSNNNPNPPPVTSNVGGLYGDSDTGSFPALNNPNNDQSLYESTNTNTNAFPNTVNSNDFRQPFSANPVASLGNSNNDFTISSNTGNSFTPTTGTVYSSSNNAFPNSLSNNQNIFPSSGDLGETYSAPNTGFSGNSLPSPVTSNFNTNAGNVYSSTNNAFPSSLNSNQNTLPSSSNLGETYSLPNTAFSDHALPSPVGNSLNTNTGIVYSDTNDAFSNSVNRNQNTLPSSTNLDGRYDVPNTVFSNNALPSAVASNLNANNNVFPATNSYGSASVTSTGGGINNVRDSGIKSTSVSLNQDELDKLSGRNNLVTGLLDSTDDFGGLTLNDGNNFNVDDAFKTPNAASNNNKAFGSDFSGSSGKQLVNPRSGNGKLALGPDTRSDDDQLQQVSEDSIAKELDARSAAAGFSGYSDNQGVLNSLNPRGANSVYSDNVGLSRNRGLPSLSSSGSSSFRPGSEFQVNTNVRDRNNQPLRASSSGLGTSGSLGANRNFGNTDRFSTQNELGNGRRGSSLLNSYNNQNFFTRNVLSDQSGQGLLSKPFSSNTFGLDTGAGSSLANNVIGGSKSSFTENGGLETSRFSSSSDDGLGTVYANNNQGLLSGSGGLSNNFRTNNQGFAPGSGGSSLGQQNFGLDTRKSALSSIKGNANQGLGTTGLGSTFNSQDLKSGVLGNIANNGFTFGNSNRNQGLNNAGLGLSSNDIGNVVNRGINDLTSSSKYTAAQSFNGGGLSSGTDFSGKGVSFGSSDGTGTNLGDINGRSSGKSSSFSSSSSGSGFGSGNSLTSGSRGLDGRNSLTGVSFGSGGLDRFGGGNAVVGSSQKVFDSGLVGTSSSVSGGGRNSYSTGNGSSVSRSTGTSYSNSDFGGASNVGSSRNGNNFSGGSNGDYRSNTGSGSVASGQGGSRLH